jgi:hypothetical protein
MSRCGQACGPPLKVNRSRKFTYFQGAVILRQSPFLVVVQLSQPSLEIGDCFSGGSIKPTISRNR